VSSTSVDRESLGYCFHRAMLCCVCPSQVGVLSKRLNESTWFLACELPSHPSYTALKGNSVISKNKGTSLWNIVLNSGLKNFATAYRSSKRVINLARERWTLKLGRRRSTKSIIPPSSDARPLQFIAQIVKRCLQHDFSHGPISDS